MAPPAIKRQHTQPDDSEDETLEEMNRQWLLAKKARTEKDDSDPSRALAFRVALEDTGASPIEFEDDEDVDEPAQGAALGLEGFAPITADTEAKDGEGKYWCATIHTTPPTKAGLKLVFDKWSEMARRGKVFTVIGQAEFGKDGKYHGQVYFEFPTNHRLARLRKEFGPYYYQKRYAHSSAQNCVDYCTKLESRAEGDDALAIKIGELREPKQGKRSDLDALADFVKDELAKGKTNAQVIKAAASKYGSEYMKYHQGIERLVLQLRPAAVFDEAPAYDDMYAWQRKACDDMFVDARGAAGTCVLRPAPPRIITFYYGKAGGEGKSALVSAISNLAGGDNLIELSGKACDAGYAFTSNPCSVAVYDMARAATSQSDWTEACKMLEGMSNGRLMNTKYVSQFVTFKRPHLIVNCNTLPRNLSSLLSVDRVRVLVVSKPTPVPSVVPDYLTFKTAEELDSFVESVQPATTGGMNF